MRDWSLHAQTAGVMLSTDRVRPINRERLVTPAFIRLGVADLAYFTATGVAIYALPLWVTGPVGSTRLALGSRSACSLSLP